MKILMVVNMLPPDTFGGAEQQCLRQAKTMLGRGHEVTILTSRFSRKTPAFDEVNGIKARRIWSIMTPDLLGRWLPFSLLWLFGCMAFAVRHRGEYDVVHCHLGKFGMFVGAVVARIVKAPQIVKIGNSYEYLDIKALQRKKFVGPLFLNYALKTKPTFVAISSVIKENLLEFGIEKSRVVQISNMVVPVKKPYVQPEKTLKFFWHGRFESIKNLDLLLGGFAEACKKQESLELYLIGNGSLEDTLRARVKELGVEIKVMFVPPPEDIIETIACFDVYVNTSLNEGMSNAMLEAMVLGKGMVSTAVSGTAEIIDQGKNGFVVAEYDVALLAEALLAMYDLYQQSSQAIYDYNLDKTEKEFRADTLAQKYEALYQSLRN